MFCLVLRVEGRSRLWRVLSCPYARGGEAISQPPMRCMADAAVPPDRAAGYAARLGVAPVDMACAHNAMLSAPDALTQILERIEP